MNDNTNERVNEWKISKWLTECVYQWMNEQMNERIKN